MSKTKNFVINNIINMKDSTFACLITVAFIAASWFAEHPIAELILLIMAFVVWVFAVPLLKISEAIEEKNKK